MTPDFINGLFEFGGSLLIWKSFSRTLADKGYAGIYVPATAFFAVWGLWNLFYYPSLGQWWSFAGGLSIVIANIAWVLAMLYYGRK
jgi:hypothetical protein